MTPVSKKVWATCASTTVVAVMATTVCAATSTAAPSAGAHRPAQHVLILSVDGLHQNDLTSYVRTHPRSAMAGLVADGTTYANASTTSPSDSFPGTVGLVTGGRPGTTGVYYDDSYDHSLDPAGTTNCTGAPTGAEVDLTEDLDTNKHSIDAGQGLAGLPASVLSMTSDPSTLIDRSALPVDPKTCAPVEPNDFLRVNTIFGVAHAAHLRTAWSDKHPAYTILNGPGTPSAIDDLFTPEINSTPNGSKDGSDWTEINSQTKQYDGYKVHAILNEIDGKDHSGRTTVGEPAIFGMNFQSVSTAEKLATSDGRTGGYLPGGTVPGPLLASSLDYVDTALHSLVTELKKTGEWARTTVVLTAKHGQSPTNPLTLNRIDDGPLIDGINHGWAATHKGAPALVAHSVDDDILLFWLSDRSRAATAYVDHYLRTASGVGKGFNGLPVPFTSSGVARLLTGVAADRYFGSAAGDPRVPDVLGLTVPGVVYTSGTKLAEHGGVAPDDLHVPLVLAGGSVGTGSVLAAVSTTQIAPTTLRILGLDPRALQAVRRDGTAILPHL